MKPFTVSLAIFLAVALMLSGLAVQSLAQGARGARSAENAAPARGESAPSAGVHSAAATAAAASVSGAVSSGAPSNYASGGASWTGIPVLTGTSFTSSGMWYNWNQYFSYLCMDYHMNPFYFNRFYRNTEPLITPEMLKLTLRKPIRQSSEMLRSIDQLEAMLRDAQEGNPVNKAALVEQSKKVRELAKQIRKNQTVSIIDLRDDKDLYKVDKENSLSPEALEKLREMALDIDRQLRNLYSQSTTSTVSVENYQEPSLESLAKGIERICKSIENSSKRL